jgi:hypothetical protein
VPTDEEMVARIRAEMSAVEANERALSTMAVVLTAPGYRRRVKAIVSQGTFLLAPMGMVYVCDISDLVLPPTR